MAKLPVALLKGLFTPGRVLTQDDWWNLIDSFVHIDYQTAVDQQVVNTKISNYDSALKGQNIDGTVNTLGDVFKTLEGYADTRNVNDELKWSGLPGKPTQITLTWTEQTIVTDSSTYNPLGSTGSAGAGPNQRWLGSTVGGLTGSFVIIDMQTTRRWYPTSSETGYYLDQITAIKVAIQPKTLLTS